VLTLIYHGDARNLDLINDESIDLIATHPPYLNIIPYSKTKKIPGDLSQVHDLDEYLNSIREIAEESYRVLKPGRYCAILIGDTRKSRHYIPVSYRVMEQFLDVGFILKESIIKTQWNTKITDQKWRKFVKSTEECWIDRRAKGVDFYLITHGHLFIFRKPSENENTRKYKYSMKWW